MTGATQGINLPRLSRVLLLHTWKIMYRDPYFLIRDGTVQCFAVFADVVIFSTRSNRLTNNTCSRSLFQISLSN